MKRKTAWGAALSALALVCGLMVVPAAAAGTAPGVYTAYMTTDYYNPDTGNVDDGGTANAALGEGMCRSATDKTALVEVDADGNVWLTVRLLLQSNCSDVKLYTRSGYDSYTQVSYDVISEDAANDSIDYRIPVTQPDQKLKCTMYVSPMGREVLWYLYVDPSTLAAGSGDFVVSIDTEAAAAAAQSQSQAQAKPETPAATQPEQTPEPGTHTQPQTPDSAQTPEDPAVSQEEPDGSQAETPDSSQPEAETAPESEPGDASASGSQDSQPPQEEEPEDARTGLSAGVIGAIAIAVVVIAGGAIYVTRRKK